jgi:serine/threonine-protein kinase
MGEVYRADDLRLRQTVALKLLPARMSSDPAWLARFHSEVRLARQVTHPNVCRVHDVGEADGLTFLSMEHVDGEDLGSLLRRVGRLPAERAAVVAREICAGLAAAHERGVLHRDLKPANVMIDGRGRARITDFGLAMVVGDARAARESAGTPAYMAPEQLDGRPVSERTDLYALGLVLYEMFTGRRAFEADSMPRLIELRHSSPPRAPTSYVADLDPGIERVILQCLDPDPSRRPGSAAAVAAAVSGPDALAAAVAAGETPSPEMVAAAGEGTALHPGVAIAVAALAVTLQLLRLLLGDTVALVNRVPFDKRPEALAERARTILDRIGVGAAAGDRAYGFAYDRRYLQWLATQDGSPDPWRKLASGQPAAVYFWYRQSARPMDAYNDSRIVTPRDPPLEPGMAFLRLDTQGRLLELLVPAGALGSSAPAEAPPWSALLSEAGLDAGTLRASPATWLPPVFADTRAVFEGTFPAGPTIPLRVEMAAHAGRPVAFRVLGPWGEPERAVAPLAVVAIGGLTAVMVPVLVIALLLARRNHRLGRSDRRGAFRIAVFAFFCVLVYGVLRYGHTRSPLREWFLFTHAAGNALFAAAAVWVLYVALEPYVRRRWPEALVSWSRVLSGRFDDGIVGRDVLVATLASAVSVSLLTLALLAPQWRGQPTSFLPLEAYLGFLTGLHRFVAWLLGFMAVTAVTVALVVVLLLVLLKALLRSTVAAAAAFWLLWVIASFPLFSAVTYGRLLPEQLVLFLLHVLLLTYIVVRYGLLATAVYLLTSGCVLEAPAAARAGAWYAEPSIAAGVVVAAVLAWGLYGSLRARPLRWEGLLER